jgi:hypothetical protein
MGPPRTSSYRELFCECLFRTEPNNVKENN